MIVDYDEGLGLMQVEKFITTDSVNIFLNGITADEIYYDVEKGQELNKELIDKVMTKRAKEHNPNFTFETKRKFTANCSWVFREISVWNFWMCFLVR